MSKKQTSVSHSSTESEVISLDAGPRMDGFPTLDLRDLVVEVLHSSSIQPTARSNGLCDKRCENIPTKDRRDSLTRRKMLVGQMLITSNAKTFSLPCFAIFFRTIE